MNYYYYYLCECLFISYTSLAGYYPLSDSAYNTILSLPNDCSFRIPYVARQTKIDGKNSLNEVDRI